MHLLTVIPARLGSTRLPNKPLRLLGGEPLIRAVVRNALAMELPGDLVVATDNDRIADAVRGLGVSTALTDPAHRSGTERVSEVARKPQYAAVDVILNLQGDEPFVSADAAYGAIDRVRRGDSIGTAAQALTTVASLDPNRVKVEVDDDGHAVGFFRAVVTPGTRMLQHLGIYALTRRSLEQWMHLSETPEEAGERLEQLRPLAAGMTIGVAVLARPVPPGVDTEEDLRMAEALR